MICMKIDKLYVGQVFKNYKELCLVLDIEIKAGMNSKESQFKELSRHCEFEKVGHKIIIKKKYDTPLPKVDRRGRSAGSRSNSTKYEPLYITHPHLIKEWDYNKNDISPNYLTQCSGYDAWWVCSKCEYDWQSPLITRANQSKGCPVCKGSKGERKISKYLKENNINFRVQYKLDGLYGINDGKLRFDFAVFNTDNSLYCLIEYDGEYHFHVRNNDIESYQRIVEHDKRKNKFCEDNNIKLTRIPYNHKKIIGEILSYVIKVK
jgi:hypothetical protein